MTVEKGVRCILVRGNGSSCTVSSARCGCRHRICRWPRARSVPATLGDMRNQKRTRESPRTIGTAVPVASMPSNEEDSTVAGGVTPGSCGQA